MSTHTISVKTGQQFGSLQWDQELPDAEVTLTVRGPLKKDTLYILTSLIRDSIPSLTPPDQL